MATPDEHQDLFARLSSEAEAIRAARPDIRPMDCEILAEGWRHQAFSPSDISAWLLAGFDPDRDWYAAALREEGVAPEMLGRFYRHRGTGEQEQLIDVVLSFLHDQRNPTALTRLLDQWRVERSGRMAELETG